MSSLTAEPLSRVTAAERVRWLWEPYLARGKLALLDGDPGVGKSLLTIDLAARLSRGGELPGGVPSGRPHVTMLLSAEDGIDTIRPRAEAAGADLDRLVTATGANGVPLRFPHDALALADAVRDHRPDLVVIDPVTAFLSAGGGSNSDARVRHTLTMLAMVAERFDCAVLMVRHLRKSGAGKAVYRGLGSIGFIASVRTGLLAARHPADASLGVLAVTKSNVAGDVPSLGYRVKADPANRPVVEWAGAANLSADALGAPPEAPLRARDRAADWLRAQLAGGPRRATELYAAAAEAGIPDRTLERAKAQLDLRSQQLAREDVREWYWYDPEAPWPKDAPFRKPFELPPLPPLGAPG
jgi:hypothetical protein